MSDEISFSSSTLDRSSGKDDSSYHSCSTEDRSSSTGTDKSQKEIQEELAAKETRDVNRSRAVVIAVLFFSAVISSALTYIFSSREEVKDFEREFIDFAHEIDEVSHHNARNVYGVIEGFALAVASFSLYSNKEWPKLSLPHFDLRARHAMKTTGADFVAFSPFVHEQDRLSWEEYSVNNTEWIHEGIENFGLVDDDYNTTIRIPSEIHSLDGTNYTQPEFDHYIPLWQSSPAPQDTSFVNYDLLHDPVYHDLGEFVKDRHAPAVSRVVNVTTLFGDAVPPMEGHPQSLLVHPIPEELDNEDETSNELTGGSSLIGFSGDVGGILTFVLPWDRFFTNLLHEGVEGIVIVMKDTCDDVFTYQIDGPHPTYLGQGDLHNTKFDHLLFIVDFEPFEWHDVEENDSLIDCHYTFHIYPSELLEKKYKTYTPIILTVACFVIFFITTSVFMAYDCSVQKRQDKVMDTAVRSDAIVSSLFPKEFRDRLFKNDSSSTVKKRKKKGFENVDHHHNNPMVNLMPSLGEAPKFRLKTFLHDEDMPASRNDPTANDGNAKTEPQPMVDTHVSKPIADLFPNATVMFADIAGFTAWSSMREPSQVFTLLETLYRAFDRIAKRRHVFKVETIGDCYVAVTGLPEPRDDHAILMARFARDCLHKMEDVMKKLEVMLGPDTGDLGMRFGLHSGAVTAGILRGDKSRFQLFGDTVNTAARMESTGEKNRIQVSEDTAKLLFKAGKAHWTCLRESTVDVKGKGQMTTYWIYPKPTKTLSSDAHSIAASTTVNELADHHSEISSDSGSVHEEGLNGSNSGNDPLRPRRRSHPRTRRRSIEANVSLDGRMERMIGWNVDVLLRILKHIVVTRYAKAKKIGYSQHDKDVKSVEKSIGLKRNVQEEVTEFVALPKFEAKVANILEDPGKVQLHPSVEPELRNFVTLIASMYRNNTFHNFEHASHVTMSVSKLLSRIVAPDVAPDDRSKGQDRILSSMHNQTYGITSDPLTQFASVFSALIHDVDHRGVPNFILVKEDEELASIYDGRSVAEQNSVDVAWDALMGDDFKHLRECIYTTTEELQRFRQLVVNTVMATDIFDKEFADLRRRRWEKCFNKPSSASTTASMDDEIDDVNRKAAIVMEHLIQASDVAHTMQHWQIYRKWNAMLFQEMYAAYRAGRSQKDPSVGWYESEIGFFDNYIIPLAKKLKQCGVFGVSSDEYLNYALENRREWSIKGRTMVEEMKRLATQKSNGTSTSTPNSATVMESANNTELANINE